MKSLLSYKHVMQSPGTFIARALRPILWVSLLMLSCQVSAEAPVVDASENYALLDKPIASTDDFTISEEQPLAKDDNATPHAADDGMIVQNKILSLQQELRELRGQLEVQARTIKQLQEQQLSFYKDIDARLQHNAPTAPETTAKPANTPAEPATGPVSTSASLQQQSAPQLELTTHNATDEQLTYLAAYELVKNRQFEKALPAMKTFAAQYPQSPYAANAQYWLGELYLSKKDYLQAIEHFDLVLKQFPTSSKTPASLLKLAYALVETGNVEQAREHLKTVMAKYPDSNTANLASAKLQSIATM